MSPSREPHVSELLLQAPRLMGSLSYSRAVARFLPSESSAVPFKTPPDCPNQIADPPSELNTEALIAKH